MKYKILFVEGNKDGTIGGSYFSLLYLIRNLDQKRYLPGVVFYFHHSLIDEFEAAGAKVFVLNTPRPINVAEYSTLSKVVLLKNILKLFQKGYNFFRLFLFRSLELLHFLKKRQIDIVHLNNSIVKNHEWMLACLLGSIKIMTHERGINQTFSKTSRFFGNRLDKIICISDAVRSNFIQKGFGSHNLATIHNGLNPGDCRVSIAANQLRQQHALRSDLPVVGVVGNIKPWKGQSVLLEAVKILRDRYRFTCYGFFVGSTPQDTLDYKRELDTFLSQNELHDCVTFTGYVKNPADYMNLFDVVVHTSIEPEPFGRVLLEAMALKKPLIATAIGAPMEILVPGVTGLLVKPGDGPALAKAIYALIQDKDRARQMGRKGYERLLSHFSIGSNVKATESIYDNLLQN